MKYKSKLYDISKEELQYLCDTSNSKTEVLEKLKMSCHGGNHSTLRKVIDERGIDLTQLNQNREKAQTEIHKRINNPIPLEQIIFSDEDFKYQSSRLKERLIEEGYKQHQCERCLNIEWLGQPIPLQLHHIDGNHNNNNINNLQILCPNCHSQTDTFAGKKLKKEKAPKIKYCSTNHKKRRKKGLSEDGTKLYDGYGNYKIICPICNKNFMCRNAKMCRNCHNTINNTPKIPKNELHKCILENMSYTQIGKLFNIDRETVRKNLKYYAENEKIKGIPDRNVLKDKIRNSSIGEICKEYNTTKTNVKIWFKLQGIPYIKSSINQINDEKWKYI